MERYIVFIIFYYFIVLKLIGILFAYSFLLDFQKMIDTKILSLMNIISNFKISKKSKKYSKEIYIASVGLYSGGTIIGLLNLNNNTGYAYLIFFTSLLFYFFGLSLKFNKSKESFDKDYFNDFLIATTIGLFYIFIENIHKYIFYNEELNIFTFLFLIMFILIIIIKYKKTYKSSRKL